MKKVLSVLLFSLFAFNANAFQVELYCNFNQAVGECSVFNQWGAPVYCNLHASGRTYSGHWISMYEQGIIYPGSYGYVYVYAQNPSFNPLAYVEGFATCQF